MFEANGKETDLEGIEIDMVNKIPSRDSFEIKSQLCTENNATMTDVSSDLGSIREENRAMKSIIGKTVKNIVCLRKEITNVEGNALWETLAFAEKNG